MKVILITGTSRGIGCYLANYYINKGYQVIGCSRSGSDIGHTNYTHIEADIAQEQDILNVFSFIRKNFKRLDILINNVGINPAILNAALLPYGLIEKVYQVNVFATILFCREAVKMMNRNKFGRIINIGSMASRHEMAGEALYTSTKAAIIAYTRVLAKEVSKNGITVNVVAPAAIETELSKKINQEALQEVLNRNAIKSYGKMEDVTNVIDLLIDESSQALTGQIIYLGGA